MLAAMLKQELFGFKLCGNLLHAVLKRLVEMGECMSACMTENPAPQPQMMYE